ncbi:helix-turn-helix domain-containing protein [Bacillus cereus group sp. N21]|uniref:helix-turn-helix domain-containing protein n=1 Tax=Bacillus cereus group sp. N21 TaxID=2794591 RepID=UPI001F5BDD62|nr:helix-turn-helix domain-containing protein [Bacillus cereus group sp. N21]
MKELRSHQVFDSLDQLNEFTDKVLAQVEMNELDRSVFIMLSRYSVKVLGVCWLKVNTIAEALEVSYKTVQRSLARLVNKNIIKRVETMRAVSGGYGASLTIMCPIGLSYREEDVEPCHAPTEEETEQDII